MRCQVCDCNLNDDESVRKDPVTKEFLDLCDGCFYDSDLLNFEDQLEFDPDDETPDQV